MLSDHCPVCLYCLSVTLVYCDQTIGWFKMTIDMQVGLGPGHIVLDGDPDPLPSKGHSPQFSAHICCRQMAGWIKMPSSSAIAEGPRDALSQLKSCQLLQNCTKNHI